MSSFPELRGTLFCDPHFVKNYLSGDPTKLKAVLDRCTTELGSFQFPKATRESELYNPIMSILNTINRAVHADPDWQPAPPAAFVDVHTESLPSHGRDTDDLYPDLVQFDYKGRHWENVRMTVEVKAKATYLKSGMKQLAEYATAVFANQIHRRHLYGLVICKWEATFVRFDRGGILFSLPIDMCAQREKFCAAFAGLMMLDNQAFGYDMAFWTRCSSRGLLDYYVDLPASAFAHVGGTSAATGMSLEEIQSLSTAEANDLAPLMRTVKVIDVLCRDGGIVGKATTVLLVREVIRFGDDGLFQTQKDIEKASRTIRGKQLAEGQEVLGTQDYALKLVWRAPDRTVEGDILHRLVGVYGAAQYMWHSDVFNRCDTPGCKRSMDNSCGNCLDKTPTGDGLWAIDNLTDLDITVPEEAEGDEETQYEEVEIDTYRQMNSRHNSHTYCRLLMSTVGIPLNSARNLCDFLRAVLDAVLAYWRLVNMGFVHQDISHGNVYMLPQEGRGYHQREWKLPQATSEDSTLAESERLLRAVLDTLGRDPAGMLGDFDLAKPHNMTNAPLLNIPPSTDAEPKSKRPKSSSEVDVRAPSPVSNDDQNQETTTPNEASSGCTTEGDDNPYHNVDFRTGTSMFMSTRVMKIGVGQRYEHHFTDDLESFFWVILWSVIGHVDIEGTYPTGNALRMLNLYSRRDLDFVAIKKELMLSACRESGLIIHTLLDACKDGNAWAVHPTVVRLVQKLGLYFNTVYTEGSFAKQTPEVVFPMVVDHIMDALKSL